MSAITATTRLGIMALLAVMLSTSSAYTPLQQPQSTLKTDTASSLTSRRGFWKQAGMAAGLASLVASSPASAAPTIYTTDKGIKFAILKPAKDKKPPLNGDIVAIEYTGYLTDGTIFDATHAEGKSNALMFELGGNAVIEGVSIIQESLQWL
jgi:FKBP-type peptidyl-prolyl cis-trans isomerase